MLRAAELRYGLAARLAASSAVLAADAWKRVPLGLLDSWSPTRLAAQISALQITLARGADGYVADALTEQGLDPGDPIRLNSGSFAGVAGDGRSLLSLFDEPRIQAKMLIGQGQGAQQAWDSALASLQLMAVTAVQDAGRAADSVAMVARPHVTGYVRMLNTPSCSRCVILAGKFFRWNTGFQRHPKCDCRHVPSGESVSVDLRVNPRRAIEAGQVTGLSQADLRAILDGADPSQVVNAQRGMYSANVFGRYVRGTTEGVTKRGLAGQLMGDFETNAVGRRFRRSQIPRLRPESIYQVAKDRDDAIRLLRRFGYLT